MIITISGQYGSGGNEIGKALAEKLGYRILDSQLVIRAREIFNAHSGGEKPVWWPSRNNEVFDEHDDIPELDCAYEQAKFRLQTDLIAPTQQYAVLGKDAEKYQAAMLYAQTRAIMEYIEDGNCIIFGKCSNFILRGRKDAIHIFTKADTESRIKRIMNLYNAPSEMKKAERWSPTAYSFEDTGNFKNMTKYTVQEVDVHVADVAFIAPVPVEKEDEEEPSEGNEN